MTVREINTLLKTTNAIEQHLFDTNPEFEIDDKWVTPPKAAMLLMKTVKQLIRKQIQSVKVVEPQTYQRVTTLKLGSNGLRPDDLALQPTGWFHTGRSGIAQTGDGGDQGDKWWHANDSLLRWLRSKQKALQVYFGANTGVNMDMDFLYNGSMSYCER